MAKRKKSYQYYPYPNLMPKRGDISDLEREIEVNRHLNTIHLYYH